MKTADYFIYSTMWERFQDWLNKLNKKEEKNDRNRKKIL